MSKTALITGASVGIGYELAKQFARGGYDLILVARNLDKLNVVAEEMRSIGVDADVIVSDLAQPAAPRALFSNIQNLGLTVDVLVNNAGFGAVGDFLKIDAPRQLEMIQVNITALVELTHLFLPAMIARRSGALLNVASTAAFQAGPHMAIYYATKAFVLSFTEAIGDELKSAGVTVTALCPGPTESEFRARAKPADAPLSSGTGMIPKMTAADVASAGFHAVQRGKRIAIPGLVNKLGVLSLRLGPRSLATRIAGKINRTK
jgi:short-subunit dehydrogenase